MSLFPEPYRIVHISRTFDEGDIDPDTGNPRLTNSAPVVRKVQSFGQSSSVTNQDDGDSLLRVTDEIVVAVSNPEAYSPGDQIIVDPELDGDGAWIEGSGTAYRVEGTPWDSRTGPWPRLTRVFGGTINARRVT